MSRVPSNVAREKWGPIVQRQIASGLSVAVFCRRNGLAASSLFAWKRRLADAAGGGFVEARLAPAAGDGPRSCQSDAAAVEVCVRGGRIIRLHPGFDSAAVGELVRTLEALP